MDSDCVAERDVYWDALHGLRDFLGFEFPAEFLLSSQGTSDGWDGFRRWASTHNFDPKSFLGEKTQYIRLFGGPHGLPSEIQYLRNLRCLTIIHTTAAILPPEIGQLNALVCLSLGDHEIETCPSEIGLLTQLTSLCLRNGPMKNIPTEIGQLELLNDVRMDHSRISCIPTELGRLSNLRKLDLCENQIRSIPQEVTLLPNLRTFKISGNRLRHFPCGSHQSTQWPKLLKLDIRSNQLKAFPDRLWSITGLRKLCINENPIKVLPSSMGQVTQLHSLSMDGCPIKHIPTEIGQLHQLTSLSLGDGSIRCVPTEIGQLQHLEFLCLSNNQLRCLPIGLITHQTDPLLPAQKQHCDLSLVYLAGNPVLNRIHPWSGDWCVQRMSRFWETLTREHYRTQYILIAFLLRKSRASLVTKTPTEVSIFFGSCSWEVQYTISCRLQQQ